jgi:SAM-dependent methyltransferase
MRASFLGRLLPSRDYLTTSFVREFPGNAVLRLIPWTKDGILARHLSPDDRVLDLGCGPRSVLMHYKVKHSIGVDLFDPYIEEARRLMTHDQVMKADCTKLEFEPNSFDVVLAFDVFDHLERQDSLALIEKTKKWARRKVVAIVTNGRADPPILDDNEFQRHRSGFTMRDMQQLGFKTYGLGLKLPGMNSKVPVIDFLIRRLTFPFWFIAYFWPTLGYDVAAIYQKSRLGG